MLGYLHVVELNQHFTAHGLRPAMISTRAKGVLAVNDLGHHSVGKTERCAYRRALKRAEEIAHAANNAQDWATAEQLMTTGSA
jgi:hypothetical protein